jgi:hypothetical protein
MIRQINVKQFPKEKEDWGFFVPIDIEQEVTEKSMTSPVMIISEKEKLQYYVKLHQPNLARSVIILKNTTELFSPRSLKNSYLHLCTFKTPPSGAVMSERGDADCAFSMCNGVKETVNTETNKKTHHRSYLVLTTILSSGLFLFFYGHPMFKYIKI